MFKSALSLAMILLTLSACGAPETETADGTWSGDGLVAEIQDGTIEINYVTDGSKSLYWLGTFDAETVTDGDVVTSEADVEELSVAMLGSTLEEKEFGFADGSLVFEVSLMGTTKTVSLSK